MVIESEVFSENVHTSLKCMNHYENEILNLVILLRSKLMRTNN